MYYSLYTDITQQKAQDNENSEATEKSAGSNDDEHGSQQEFEGGLLDEDDISTSEQSDHSMQSNRAYMKAVGRTLRRHHDLFQTNTEVQARALVQHLKMMEWITNTLETAGHADQSPRPQSVPRTKSTPEIKRLTWFEWSRYDTSHMKEHHAVHILCEEPIGTGWRGDELDTSREPEGIVNLSRHSNGIKTLPSRLRLCSLPAKRILATMAGNGLGPTRRSTTGETAPPTILRPFKVLVYLEDKIRRRQSDLEQHCKEPTGRPMNPVHPEQTIKATSVDEKEPAQTTHSDIFMRIRDNSIFSASFDWTQLTLEERQEAAQDFGLLVSFMDEYIFPLRKALQGVQVDDVYFHELWHLFSTGSIVYVKDVTVPQKLWRVMQGTGGRRPIGRRMENVGPRRLGVSLGQTKCDPFNLDCFYIDFDGSEFVRVRKTFRFEEFNGLQSIRSLPIIPLHIAEHQGLIDRSILMDRAASFISHTKVSYCYYSGRSLSREPGGNVLRRPDSGTMGSMAVLPDAIESAVVVDFQRCLHLIPDWNPRVFIYRLSKTPEDEVLPPPGGPELVDDDRVWDLCLAERVLEHTDKGQSLERYGRTPPTGDDLLLLPDRVFVFVLRTRRWGKSLTRTPHIMY